jgi:DNA-binding transcriptional ArsR family regulator
MSHDKEEEKKLISQLKGNTLRAYWAILSSKDETMGVRELQRKLNLSSPALASYHLAKLEELGLVSKKSGDYKIAREVNVGIFTEFVKLGTFRLPRFLMYSMFFTVMLIFLVTQFKEVNMYSVYALITIILIVAILWYETLRVWQQKP